MTTCMVVTCCNLELYAAYVDARCLQECLYAMRAEKKLAAAIGKKYAGNSYSMISMSPAELQVDQRPFIERPVQGMVTKT